jgi:hypothetical protein
MQPCKNVDGACPRGAQQTRHLALRTPERLRLGPDLIPRVSPPRESEPAWQLPASTVPSSLGQADARPKRKRQGTIRYKEGREDGYIGSVGFSQLRM